MKQNILTVSLSPKTGTGLLLGKSKRYGIILEEKAQSQIYTNDYKTLFSNLANSIT